MAEDTRDLLMQVVKSGRPLVAECAAALAPGDSMATGFTAGSAGKWGNYFSVQAFQMELGLLGEGDSDMPQDPAALARKRQEEHEELLQQALAAKDDDEDARAPVRLRSASEYGRFMNLPRGASLKNSRGFAANLEYVSITKPLELASMALFQACVDSTRLDSAVLIKRRAGGGQALQTFMRFEFQDVLITDFNWDDDDVIREKIRFICRSATVKYSIQQPDGTLTATGQPGQWRMWNLTGQPGV